MSKHKLYRTTVGWRVIATVKDEMGQDVLKSIGQTYAVKSAAEDCMELAIRQGYPDAYVQVVTKRERAPFPFS